MPVVANSRSKLLCRLILYMLKIIPYVTAVGYITYTGFAFYNIDLPFIGYDSDNPFGNEKVWKYFNS